MFLPALHHRFLCFDGTKGCGKSSLIDSLAIVLINSGFNPIVVKQPSKVFYSLDRKDLDILTLNDQASLYRLDRAFLLISVLDELKKDTRNVVLSDRGEMSTMVYNGQFNYELMPLEPMMYYFIDCEPEIAAQRRAKRDLEPLTKDLINETRRDHALFRFAWVNQGMTQIQRQIPENLNHAWMCSEANFIAYTKETFTEETYRQLKIKLIDKIVSMKYHIMSVFRNYVDNAELNREYNAHRKWVAQKVCDFHKDKFNVP